MSTFNSTSFRETQFVVLCFPGDWSWWKGLLGAVLLLLFFVALFANLSLVLVISTERCFHTPMYYFVCCLSVLDSALCLIVVPIVLAGLLFDLKTINASTCFLQLYFIGSLVATQSGVLMLMAYDRYVAICKPLQYPLIISNKYVTKAIAAICVRGCTQIMPLTILPAQLDYCHGNIIHNCYCNSLEVSVLACDSNPIIGVYNVVSMFFTTVFEMSIIFSYFMIIRAVLLLPSKSASFKAFNTCGSHFIVISFYYFSLIILVITNIHGDRIPSDIRTLITILFCTIPPAINPLVYGLRTKGFMQSILTKLKMWKYILKVVTNVSKFESRDSHNN